MMPRREVLRGWGMANQARSWIYRPRDADEVEAALQDARERGLSVCHRGAGLSYGDAALNEGGAMILTEGLHRLLNFNPDTGLLRAECGLRLVHIWKDVLPYGWWLPVVPGTMEVTLGGAVAMNVHGKNQFSKGSFGEHVTSLTLLRASGVREELPAVGEPEGLRDVVGAQGLNGTILDATIQLHRVHSGLVEVEARATRSLVETLGAFEEGLVGVDYAVGWIDCMAGANGMGRGLLHFARQLPADHPRALEAMSVDEQRLPSRSLGVIPNSQLWRGLRVLSNDSGMRVVNLGRSLSGRLRQGRRYLQTLAAFHFLLDTVPGWRRAYGPHGLIQYQLFVPLYNAGDVFREVLALQRSLGVYSYLGVLKRHRTDDFAGSYALDGYSLALDFPVRAQKLAALRRLCRSYDDLLRDSCGHVYAAKDAVSRGVLPRTRDPLYSSNLVRRWERPERPRGPASITAR